MPTTSTNLMVQSGLSSPLANLLGRSIQTLAGAGTAQATAKTITPNSNYVLMTTAGGETAFKLSTAWAVGQDVEVVNSSATAALLFPQVGGAIDAGSTDASVSIAQNESRTFTKVSATSWRSGETVQSVTTLSVSGNATVGGTLGVTGVLTGTAKAAFPAGMNTKQAVTQVNDTTPTAAELTTAFGAAATLGRGFVGTIDDNDGDTNGYLVFTSDASFYFLKFTKAT